MNHWQRVKDLFQQAVELPKEQRAAFLANACGSEDALRAEVEQLLASDEELVASGNEGDAFLEAPTLESTRVRDGGASQEVTWERFLGSSDGVVGPYRAVKLLGQGGMGAVILGERVDDQFQQWVAIKVMRGDQFGFDRARRFQRERQLLASMEHPHIARMFDGGMTSDGRPYFVMEYVRGTHLTAYCKEQGLSVEQRLRLFIKVCDAVSYAHRKLIVHRDLKPGNIMVDESGEPRLLDFGIAKILEGEDGLKDTLESPLTRTGQVCLTPDYASPEQFRGSQVTTASDVYALGVILFELLTDTRPFDFRTVSPLEMDRIKNTEPLPRPSSMVGTLTRDLADPEGEVTPWNRPETPSRLRRMLRGDLDNIVHMAMRLEPQRRYPSADQLGQDVADYLAHKPVRAQPDAWTYRLRKLLRRHRLAFSAAALVLLSLIGGFVATFQQWRRAEYEYRVAAEIADFMTGIFQAADPEEAQGEEIRVRDLLDEAARRIDGELASEPAARARLMRVIADSYLGLGCFEQALELYQKVLPLEKEKYGSDHETVGDTLNNIGLALRRLGRYTEAASRYQAALAIFRKRSPGDSKKMAMALNNLGSLWDDLGRKQEARALYEEALAMCERVYGTEHPAHATLTNNLAVIYESQGDDARAERSYQQVLEKVTRLLGEKHPYALASMINLARVKRLQGKTDAARQVAQKAVDLSEAVFPEENVDLADARVEFAAVLTESGELDSARRQCERALASYATGLPPQHPRVAAAQLVLANLLRRQHAWTEAVNAYERSLRILESAEHQDRFREACIHFGWGECLKAMDDPSAALDHLERADQILAEIRPAEDALRKRVASALTELSSESTDTSEPGGNR